MSLPPLPLHDTFPLPARNKWATRIYLPIGPLTFGPFDSEDAADTWAGGFWVEVMPHYT